MEIISRAVTRGQNELIGEFKMLAGDVINIRDYIIQTLPKARHKMAGDVKINVFPAIRTRLGTFQDGGAKSFNDGCLEDSSL